MTLTMMEPPHPEVVVSHDNSLEDEILLFANDTQGALGIADAFKRLIELKNGWESGEQASATKKLYGILAHCHVLYEKLEAIPEQDRTKLNNHLPIGFRVTKRSDLATLVSKIVFGKERRKAHAYATVLRAAKANAVRPECLPDFIVKSGGIENIRTQKGTAAPEKLSAFAKRAKATEYIEQNNLALSFPLPDEVVQNLPSNLYRGECIALADVDNSGTMTIKFISSQWDYRDKLYSAVFSNIVAPTLKVEPSGPSLVAFIEDDAQPPEQPNPSHDQNLEREEQ